MDGPSQDNRLAVKRDNTVLVLDEEVNILSGSIKGQVGAACAPANQGPRRSVESGSQPSWRGFLLAKRCSISRASLRHLHGEGCYCPPRKNHMQANFASRNSYCSWTHSRNPSNQFYFSHHHCFDHTHGAAYNTHGHPHRRR